MDLTPETTKAQSSERTRSLLNRLLDYVYHEVDCEGAGPWLYPPKERCTCGLAEILLEMEEREGVGD